MLLYQFIPQFNQIKMKKYYLLEVYDNWGCTPPGSPPDKDFRLKEYDSIHNLIEDYKKGPRHKGSDFLPLHAIDIIINQKKTN